MRGADNNQVLAIVREERLDFREPVPVAVEEQVFGKRLVLVRLSLRNEIQRGDVALLPCADQRTQGVARHAIRLGDRLKQAVNLVRQRGPLEHVELLARSLEE